MTYEERIQTTINEYKQKFIRDFAHGKTAKETAATDQALMVADALNISKEYNVPHHTVLHDMGHAMLNDADKLKSLEQGLRGFLKDL